MLASIVDTYEVCGLSLNRPAYQSSTYTSDDGFQHKAKLANDGYHSLTTCAVTNTGPNQWWMVDFGAFLTLTNVTFKSGAHVGKVTRDSPY